MNNVLHHLPTALSEELTQTLLTGGNFRIERIVSLGHASAEGFWYDQPENEWVLLLSGSARLRFEDDDRPIEMSPGSFVNIPAHRRHRVDWTDPQQHTVWLAIHYTS